MTPCVDTGFRHNLLPLRNRTVSYFLSFPAPFDRNNGLIFIMNVMSVAKAELFFRRGWRMVREKTLGKNTLAIIMTNISRKANLSKHDTNHCVRATCITVLGQITRPTVIYLFNYTEYIFLFLLLHLDSFNFRNHKIDKLLQFVLLQNMPY
jgi:hypothetical protein